MQGFDNADTVEALTREAMEQLGLVGVYAVGAGNRGVVRALEGHAPRPVVIVHELTSTTRASLLSSKIDLVIDQNPVAEVQAAITLMRDLSDQRPINAKSGEIPLSIFVRENV